MPLQRRSTARGERRVGIAVASMLLWEKLCWARMSAWMSVLKIMVSSSMRGTCQLFRCKSR